MKQAATQALYDYWDGLRGERLAPERHDVDPVAMRGILADTFMADVLYPADPDRLELPIRMSGTRINGFFGEDLKDRNLLTLWSKRDIDSVISLIRTVLDDSCAAVAGVSTAPPGQSPVAIELLLLPLRHKGKTHARLLGSMVPVSIPQWLGRVPTEELVLTSTRILGPMRRRSGETAQVSSLRGDVLASMRQRHGHLSVVPGGRSHP